MEIFKVFSGRVDLFPLPHKEQMERLRHFTCPSYLR